MAKNVVEIYAVSIQNEPDIQVSYESCDWTSSEMISFLNEYGIMIIGTKVSAPESFNFNKGFTNAILNDEGAAANIDLVSGHIYGGGIQTFPIAEQQRKEIWMTEYLLNLNTGASGSLSCTNYSESEKWDESLEMLHTVHKTMIRNWNAYIWWYIQRYYSFIGDGEQGTISGSILKRGYAFPHFSRYIRPGFVRKDVKTNLTSDLEITAYEGYTRIVVVIINRNNLELSNIKIDVPVLSGYYAFETSLNRNMIEKEINLSDGKPVINISPKSVTTVLVEK